MVFGMFVRPHQKRYWFRNPDVVFAAQCAWENSYQLIFCNLCGPQVYDERVGLLFAPLNIYKVSSFNIKRKDDEIVYKRSNQFFKVGHKFIEWSVKLKITLKTVSIIRHGKFILSHVNLSSLLKSKVSFSVCDYDSLLIFGKVKQTLLDVNLLFSLHIKHEISSRCFPVSAEIEIKKNVMLLVINLFERANLILLKLLN